MAAKIGWRKSIDLSPMNFTNAESIFVDHVVGNRKYAYSSS